MANGSEVHSVTWRKSLFTFAILSYAPIISWVPDKWLSLLGQFLNVDRHFISPRFFQVKVAQPCPILWDPVDYTLHGIFQARILEWVAVPFSRESSQPGDRTQVCHNVGGFFTSWATREALIWWQTGLLWPPWGLPEPASTLVITAHPTLSPRIPRTKAWALRGRLSTLQQLPFSNTGCDVLTPGLCLPHPATNWSRSWNQSLMVSF